jgi:hypothetical protein
MNRSLARLYDASCRNKVRFATVQDAEQERARYDHPLYLYACKWCHGIHLTREKQRRKV